MANQKIEEIEGIGPAFADKLRGAGIADTDGLLAAGTTRKGRLDIADKTGISEKHVLRWVNMTDLFRINGVGPEMSELLEAAGVDTVPELATRNAANLVSKLVEINEQKRLTRRTPSEVDVSKWIAEAKDLPRAIEY